MLIQNKCSSVGVGGWGIKTSATRNCTRIVSMHISTDRKKCSHPLPVLVWLLLLGFPPAMKYPAFSHFTLIFSLITRLLCMVQCEANREAVGTKTKAIERTSAVIESWILFSHSSLSHSVTHSVTGTLPLCSGWLASPEMWFWLKSQCFFLCFHKIWISMRIESINHRLHSPLRFPHHLSCTQFPISKDAPRGDEGWRWGSLLCSLFVNKSNRISSVRCHPPHSMNRRLICLNMTENGTRTFNIHN